MDNRKPHEDIARELAILDINYEFNVVSLVEDLVKNLDSIEEQEQIAKEIEAQGLRNTPLSVDVIMPLTAVCPKCSAAMYGG